MNNNIYQGSDKQTIMISKVRRSPTSIKVDENLWIEFKIAAMRRKLSTTELLERLMREYLKSKK